jgi:hypothetical protein
MNDEVGTMNKIPQFNSHSFSFIVLLLLLSSLNLSCNIIGAAAQALPPDTIKPQYFGLVGQTVGVMVWTDRGVSMDFPSISLDLANSIQHKLVLSAKEKELKQTTFPIKPASIIRYQQDHPELDITNVAEIAPKLGVSRLIYIEVEDFGTRAPASVDLFRGNMAVTMKIVEVNNGLGKVAYSEDNIKAVYPNKVPDDGTPNGDDGSFYMGTIDAMSTQIVWRLVSHEEDPDQQ